MSQQPFSSDGGFSTTGNVVAENVLVVGSIGVSGVASPAPSLNGFDSINSVTVSASGNITGGTVVTSGSGGDITMSGGNITGAGNIVLTGGKIQGGTTTVVTDGINSISLSLGAQMDVFGFPFDYSQSRGQLTITGDITTTEALGTWYYQATSSNAYQLYTDSTYTELVDATTWTPYTGGGLVAITKTSYPSLNVVIDTNGYLTTFSPSGDLTLPNGTTIGTPYGAGSTGISAPINTDFYINVEGNTGGHSWSFDQNGNTYLPGALTFFSESANAVNNVRIGTTIETSFNLTLQTREGIANIFLPGYDDFYYGNAPGINVSVQGSTWTFGTDGNLTLPGNTSSINYLNGSPYSGGNPFDQDLNTTDSVTFDSVNATTFSATGNITGANFIGNTFSLAQTILPTIQSITITKTSSEYETSGGSGYANVLVANVAPVIEYGVIVTAGSLNDKYVIGNLANIPGTEKITISTGTSDQPFTVYAYVTTNAGTYYSGPEVGFSGMCLLKGTMISLADGTYKPIEDINNSDLLLTWDFDLGQYAQARPLWIKRGETGTRYNKLTFSDGTTLRTFDQHRIFNKQAGAFTYPMSDDTPIGTVTVNEHGQEIALVKREIVWDTIEHYNIITDYHINLFADSVLTSCRFNNIYPITDMKFVKDVVVNRNLSEFAEIESRFVSGLRLQEQSFDLTMITGYVNRLLATEASELIGVQVNTMAITIGSGITVGAGVRVIAHKPPSTTFFPLSNTATDPTSAEWQANNPGYTFVPNMGITTLTPMTNASYMFFGNTTFNDPDVALWDTSSVTNMFAMFQYNTAFNQPLNSWNTANVIYMNSMFDSAVTFNGDISGWDTGNVTNMGGMFFGAQAFNQPLNSWNTANVTSMNGMFMFTSSFNQPLNSWNTANVTNMSNMFRNNPAFNQDLSSWNTSRVTDMSSMFNSSYAFNSNISSWNTSSVTDMNNMFNRSQAFNQDISSWDVGRVTDMSYMFYTPNFNCGQAAGVAHDLMQRTATTGWQVGNVTNMNGMFYNATAFNGNISAWCETLIATTPTDFATGANVNFTTGRQPTWGACPYPNV